MAIEGGATRVPLAEAACRGALADDCGGAGGFLNPATRARIDAGTVRYNAAAAGNVIGQLRALTSCDNPLVAVGWSLPEVFTFGGTFTGTLAPGATCSATTGEATFAGECANGICGDFGGPSPQCIGFAGLGARCGIGTNVACVDLNASFSSLESNDILLRCNVAPGAMTGTCAARFAVGAACLTDNDCESTRCEADVCIAPLANGVECSNDSDCMSGWCDSRGSTSACAALGNRANGETCSADQDCASANCAGATCAASICSVVDTPPPAPTP